MFDPINWGVKSVNQVATKNHIKFVFCHLLLLMTVPLIGDQIGQSSFFLLVLHHINKALRVIIGLNLKKNLKIDLVMYELTLKINDIPS